jgi:hypothetical protein
MMHRSMKEPIVELYSGKQVTRRQPHIVTLVVVGSLIMTGCMDEPKQKASDELKKRLDEMGISAKDVHEPVKREPVKVGDRLELYGGYDYEPRYLQNPKADFKQGTVIGFIPSDTEGEAVIMKLDTAIVGDSITGDIVVLSTRYVGQDWSFDGAVHIELCDFVPPASPWKDRPQGEWIEAAASYKKLTPP